MGEWSEFVASCPFINVRSFLPNKVLPSASVAYKTLLKALGAYTCEHWSPKSILVGLDIKASSSVRLL